MAKAGTKVHPGRRKADPMFTRNGRPRLKPLNLKQLETMLEKTSVKKTQAKIRQRIDLLKKRVLNEKVNTNKQDATS